MIALLIFLAGVVVGVAAVIGLIIYAARKVIIP